MPGVGATYGLQIPGPILIEYDLNFNGQGSNLRVLGYSRDGVDLSFNGFERPVHSDRNGGTEGVPVDMLQYGEMCDVSLVLVDFDQSELEQLYIHTTGTGGTYGTNITPGTVLFGTQGGSADKSFDLQLNATDANYDYHFPASQLVWPRTLRAGNMEAQHGLLFRCFPNSNGVLFDSTLAT